MKPKRKVFASYVALARQLSVQELLLYESSPALLLKEASAELAKLALLSFALFLVLARLFAKSVASVAVSAVEGVELVQRVAPNELPLRRHEWERKDLSVSHFNHLR